jgi:hypothetical protein
MRISFVTIARLRDHLTLASTVDDEQSVAPVKAEARKFHQAITRNSQPRITHRLLRSNLHICVSNFVFAFCASDCDFDPQAAYQMLEQSIMAFNREYSDSLDAVEQEYAFADFHSMLDSLRLTYKTMVALANLRHAAAPAPTPTIKIALLQNERPVETGFFSANLGIGNCEESKSDFCGRVCRPLTIICVVAILIVLAVVIAGER